jgi:hypothetical protein
VGEFGRCAVARRQHNNFVSKKTKKNTIPETTSPKSRRKLTLIEVLVVAAVGAVILRLLYHVVHWRDVVNAFVELRPFEWGIIALFVVAYYFLNKPNAKS